jgi:hypothetical protein
VVVSAFEGTARANSKVAGAETGEGLAISLSAISCEILAFSAQLLSVGF